MATTAKLPRTVEALAESTLRSRAHTSCALRQAVEARAAVLGGGTRQYHDVPATLRDYVDKVALHAYRITDDDVRGLQAAGYSEDEIFELTLCAALGAGLARFERGLAALCGEEGRIDAAADSRSGTYP